MSRPAHEDFGDFPARLVPEDAVISRPTASPLTMPPGAAQPYKSPKSPSCGRAAPTGGRTCERG